MKRRQKIVDDYVLKQLKDAGLGGEDLIKHVIIWKQFFKQVKPSLTKLSTVELCHFAASFLIFVIQFETICGRAFKKIGTQSIAQTIISMYSSRDLLVTDDPEETTPRLG